MVQNIIVLVGFYDTSSNLMHAVIESTEAYLTTRQNDGANRKHTFLVRSDKKKKI